MGETDYSPGLESPQNSVVKLVQYVLSWLDNALGP